MNSKPVFPFGALQARISSALYHLENLIRETRTDSGFMAIWWGALCRVDERTGALIRIGHNGGPPADTWV